MFKSPFLVIENFISPLLADEIIVNTNFNTPDLYPDDKPMVTTKFDEEFDDIISDRINKLVVPILAKHFDTSISTIHPIEIEMLVPDAHVPVHADGFNLVDNNWVKTKPWDFTAILFLSEHTNETNIDDLTQCNGGKLEFINFNFSFNPTVGTLIVFPNDPRFSNASSYVKIGECYQIRIHLQSDIMYLYDPSKFKGSPDIWFS